MPSSSPKEKAPTLQPGLSSISCAAHRRIHRGQQDGIMPSPQAYFVGASTYWLLVPVPILRTFPARFNAISVLVTCSGAKLKV